MTWASRSQLTHVCLHLHLCPVPLPSLLMGHCHLQIQVGVTLRAFVAEQRSGWRSVPKAKSHSSVRSEPAGSALAEQWRGMKEPLWDTCEDESEFVEIVCVYI